MASTFRVLIGAVAAALCSGCVYQPMADDIAEHLQRAQMIGCWFIDHPDGDRRRHSLSTRRSDGTFEIAFRGIRNGEISFEQTETGRWGLDWPIYFSITETIDSGEGASPTNLRNPHYYDAYHMTRLSDDEMKYTSYSTGDVYVARKIHGDCVFPETP